MPDREKEWVLFAARDDPAAVVHFEAEGAHPELD
jgi:hypothetical protein